MLRQLARQALCQRSGRHAWPVTALAGCAASECCNFAAGANTFHRAPKRLPATDKAASKVVVKDILEDRLASPPGKQADPTWVPVRHESGKVYYWNKKTGANRAAELAIFLCGSRSICRHARGCVLR